MDQQQIQTALHRPASALGVLPQLVALRPQFDLYLYDTLPSTNAQAWALVAQGRGAGTVVIARQQTAGRGQWGRTWVSPPGGLYLSLVLVPDLEVRDRHRLTLASAWGLATALENLGIPIQLKWPNDLVSQGRKVGGILVESRLSRVSATPTGQTSPNLETLLETVVIGLGLNWQNPLPESARSLVQLLPDPPPPSLKTLEDLAAIALRGLLQGYQYWHHQGTEALMTAYQQKLAHLGQPVTVDGHLGQVTGVSSNGELTVSIERDGQKIAHAFKPGEIRLGYNS